ncbi:MAG: TPM domain-containing protein [Candidatus Latescibacteria bacterium]|nr:TPM domain-containing protein [Candidatus Latescibacterota bacterium]
MSSGKYLQFISFMLMFIFIILPTECKADNFPDRAGHVNDFAGLLQNKTIREFDNYLRELWISTGVEVVVLTVKHMNKLDENTYAMEIFKRWDIGATAHDGVLIFLSMKERTALIEVGYGLEQILPKDLTRSILNKNMIPSLKKNKFDEGISGGILSISTWIKAGRGNITGKVDSSLKEGG